MNWELLLRNLSACFDATREGAAAVSSKVDWPVRPPSADDVLQCKVGDTVYWVNEDYGNLVESVVVCEHRGVGYVVDSDDSSQRRPYLRPVLKEGFDKTPEDAAKVSKEAIEYLLEYHERGLEAVRESSKFLKPKEPQTT